MANLATKLSHYKKLADELVCRLVRHDLNRYIYTNMYSNIYHHALFEDYISSFGFKYDLDTVLYFGASLD